MNAPANIAKAQVRAVIAQTRLFADWPPSLIDMLASQSELRCFADGDYALRSGVPSQHIVIVAKGSFMHQRTMTDGTRILSDRSLPGQLTSHLAALDGHPPAFDIVARGPAEMVFIPRAAFLDAIARDPDRLMDVIQLLCRRTRLEYEANYMRAANTLRCQLAKLIVYWSRGLADAGGNSAEIPIDISQDDIAAFFGRARQTINREINGLIRDGILARSYMKIRVLDVRALMAIIDAEEPDSWAWRDRLFTRPANVLKGSD